MVKYREALNTTMSQTETKEREISTIDKLVETEEKTNRDGTVAVTIGGWEESRGGGNIVVTFITPTGEQKSEKMTFPQPGGDLRNYKFYRLIKSAGLGMRNADLLEGSEARARVYDNGDTWTLQVPDDRTTTEKVSVYLAEAWNWTKRQPWSKVVITGTWLLVILFLVTAIMAVV